MIRWGGFLFGIVFTGQLLWPLAPSYKVVASCAGPDPK